MCFCKNSGKHPEPVTVLEGYVKSRRSMFDTSRRSCYLEINRIRVFVDRHEGVNTTHGKLKELDDLRRAL